jgi:acyl-CoA synthetase (AMP-forming)/AMP-acid ligase II
LKRSSLRQCRRRRRSEGRYAASWSAARRRARNRLADYKVPEGVTIDGDPLPRNANGKIQKPLLRERLAALQAPASRA